MPFKICAVGMLQDFSHENFSEAGHPDWLPVLLDEQGNQERCFGLSRLRVPTFCGLLRGSKGCLFATGFCRAAGFANMSTAVCLKAVLLAACSCVGVVVLGDEGSEFMYFLMWKVIEVICFGREGVQAAAAPGYANTGV